MNPKIAHPDAPDGIVAPALHSAPPTFGLLLIGDELLSGRRADQHVPKAIELLGARGLALSYVHMVGDDRPRLTAALQAVFASGDVVLCCGGIGATPDDHTRQAAAAALNLPLVMQPQAQALIEQRMRFAAAEKGEVFDPQRADNIQRLQMAVFPQGAQIVPNPYNRIAGFSVGHAHFFPGFPQMAWPMMQWVLDTHYTSWQGQRDWCELHAIVLSTHEAALTPLMQQIEQQWPDVKIFSLPSVAHPVHGPHIELGVKGPHLSARAAYTVMLQYLQHARIAVAGTS